jgi:tetratricopeptide (TPR) repeat protein
VRILTDIPETDDLATSARLVAGQIEKSRHRIRRAEALFLDALRLDPRLAQARRELILIYGMQARRADLKTQYRALAEITPLQFDDVLLWTVGSEDIWINDTIRPELEKFLTADPEDRASRLALAEVLLAAGRLDQSEAVLGLLSDSDLDGRVLRARIALGRLQLDKVRALVSVGPAEHAGLALLRGYLAIKSKDLQTADREFRRALKVDPTNREAIQGIALVLKQVDKPEKAAPYLRMAEQWRHMTDLLQRVNTPEGRHDGVLLRQLGETCEALGQYAEARAWYQLALALDPLDAAIQHSLYRLRD